MKTKVSLLWGVLGFTAFGAAGCNDQGPQSSSKSFAQQDGSGAPAGGGVPVPPAVTTAGGNADTLDGLDGVFYQNAANLTGTINPGVLPTDLLRTTSPLPAANITGLLGDASLSTNIPRLNGTNTFTGTVNLPAGTTLNGVALVNGGGAAASTNALTLNNQPATFYQDATNLNAGTLNAARLPNNINAATLGGQPAANFLTAASNIADARIPANIVRQGGNLGTTATLGGLTLGSNGTALTVNGTAVGAAGAPAAVGAASITMADGRFITFGAAPVANQGGPAVATGDRIVFFDAGGPASEYKMGIAPGELWFNNAAGNANTVFYKGGVQVLRLGEKAAGNLNATFAAGVTAGADMVARGDLQTDGDLIVTAPGIARIGYFRKSVTFALAATNACPIFGGRNCFAGSVIVSCSDANGVLIPGAVVVGGGIAGGSPTTTLTTANGPASNVSWSCSSASLDTTQRVCNVICARLAN